MFPNPVDRQFSPGMRLLFEMEMICELPDFTSEFDMGFNILMYSSVSIEEQTYFSLNPSQYWDGCCQGS